MDKLDRFQTLHRVFRSHKRPVPISKITAELDGCSEKTAKRLIDTMRDYWELPLEYSKEAKGWYYNLKQDENWKFLEYGSQLTSCKPSSRCCISYKAWMRGWFPVNFPLLKKP